MASCHTHAATGWRYVSRCLWLALLFKHANCVGMAGCHTLLRKSHASRWEAWLFYVCLCYVCHPHRPTQTSASTDADIRTDRRRHPHRPTQTSVSTDADIRTDRRGHLHRPTQMAFLLLYMRSGTSMPSSAMPFFNVLPTFCARTRRTTFSSSVSAPRIE
jgi:hypothetical protein